MATRIYPETSERATEVERYADTWMWESAAAAGPVGGDLPIMRARFKPGVFRGPRPPDARPPTPDVGL
jgi:hypothetical protein